MKIKKIFKIIGGIVAIAGVIAAIYLAIQKLTDKKEPDDFFECDNDLEIIEVDKNAAKEEAPAEEAKEEAAPKKKKAAKKASK